MFSYARRALTIESQVPFGTVVWQWLQLHAISFSKFVESSRRYERSYLAWEAVRKVRNPFFTDGTGFEGYYVGQCLSAEEIAEQLLAIGRYMLISNYRLYRFNHLFRARLMKTLFAAANDPQAIEVWAAQFGAALGRLRCSLLTNIQTRSFQTQTYDSTRSLPAMCYAQEAHAIQQKYVLPCRGSGLAPYWNMNLQAFMKPGDADAYFVVQTVGKFGHPLVRAYLDSRSLR
jgi:hypothetical protein